MCSGEGVFPQCVNKYQMVTFVVCPEVNQVEQPTARVHTASINRVPAKDQWPGHKICKDQCFYIS